VGQEKKVRGALSPQREAMVRLWREKKTDPPGRKKRKEPSSTSGFPARQARKKTPQIKGWGEGIHREKSWREEARYFFGNTTRFKSRSGLGPRWGGSRGNAHHKKKGKERGHCRQIENMEREKNTTPETRMDPAGMLVGIPDQGDGS